MTFTVSVFCALAVVLLALYLKPQQKEIAVLLAVFGVVLLFSFSLGHTRTAVEAIRNTVQDSAFSGEVETMLKALGIAAASQITSDICREGGEPFVASQIELIGKMEIVLLSLPMLSRLLVLVRDTLS